MPYLQ